MKKILRLVVVAAMVLSYCEIGTCQQWQQARPFQPAVMPGVSANLQSQNRRVQYPSGRISAHTVPQTRGDGSGWTAVAVNQAMPNQNPNLVPVNPNSVNVSDQNPQMIQSIVEPPVPYQSSMSMNAATGRTDNYGTSGAWSTGGGTPYVMGDIFGVGRDDYCDEWANLCPCLELTNGRSNCECTNPYRSKTEPPCRHGYRINQASCYGGNGSGSGCQSCTNSDPDCQTCDRSAQRSKISDYFHPRQPRR